MTSIVIIICLFTFCIHFSESIAYCLRLAGLKTGQIAIAMSFVTSTLLVSRMSNMFQAPLLGTLVDTTILAKNAGAIHQLETNFRLIIFAGCLGSILGALLTPTAIQLFSRGIQRFLHTGSLPKVVISIFYPSNLKKMPRLFCLPKLVWLKQLQWRSLPKGFLIFNVGVTAIYTIGVLCALLAGTLVPEFRATAINLSGIINGMATILLTLFVDPSGARITDQTHHGARPFQDAASVVFFLLMGRIVGILIFSQMFLLPFTHYVVMVTRVLASTHH